MFSEYQSNIGLCDISIEKSRVLKKLIGKKKKIRGKGGSEGERVCTEYTCFSKSNSAGISIENGK